MTHRDYLAANLAHESDCAVHNEPAYPAGNCNCEVSDILAAWDAREDALTADLESAAQVLRDSGLATGHGDSAEDLVKQAIWQIEEKHVAMWEAASLTCCDLEAIAKDKSHADGAVMSKDQMRSVAASSWTSLRKTLLMLRPRNRRDTP